MAYDELLADRIRQHLKDKHTHFTELKMMGGLCFKVDDKMLCGLHIDKKYGDSLLMARIGVDTYEKELKKPECLPMDFTGRPMKGYIFITPEGIDNDDNLAYWLDLCLDFNPLANTSKPKKNKNQ
ncbi:TfoX/Sxy family protein [Algibacter sp. AS12]|uniref:TfoX/Sxy family protein n=1 Tax=Algibacter sp. AS12 TaxID=3135773 RepID=UPI00398A610A